MNDANMFRINIDNEMGINYYFSIISNELLINIKI